MSDFRQRLLEEKSSLDEKITKLMKFVTDTEKFNSVATVQQSLLKIQLQSMMTYSQCLEERILYLSETVTA